MKNININSHIISSTIITLVHGEIDTSIFSSLRSKDISTDKYIISMMIGDSSQIITVVDKDSGKAIITQIIGDYSINSGQSTKSISMTVGDCLDTGVDLIGMQKPKKVDKYTINLQELDLTRPEEMNVLRGFEETKSEYPGIEETSKVDGAEVLIRVLLSETKSRIVVDTIHIYADQMKSLITQTIVE